MTQADQNHYTPEELDKFLRQLKDTYVSRGKGRGTYGPEFDELLAALVKTQSFSLLAIVMICFGGIDAKLLPPNRAIEAMSEETQKRMISELLPAMMTPEFLAFMFFASVRWARKEAREAGEFATTSGAE